MQEIFFKSIIIIFSTQGLVDHYGLLPRHFIYLAHILIMGNFLYLLLCDIYRILHRKKIILYNTVDKILIIFFAFGIILIFLKNVNFLTGAIGVKNLLMFPMIYFIIRRAKTLKFEEVLNFYLKIFLFQIPVIFFQGITTNWDDEMLTGTLGYHTTGINGVIYSAIASLGIVQYFIMKKRNSLYLILFLIIPGISGVRASFLLLSIVALIIGIYYLIFLKKKGVFLIKGLILFFLVFNIVDYTHLAIEKVKISTLYKNRFSEIMRQQIYGYGIKGSNDDITHFGRISSLIFVWSNLTKQNNFLFGNGPGLARDSLFGKSVKIDQGFKFSGSPGGIATIWFEWGTGGIIIYLLMATISCFIIFFKALKFKLLNINPYVLWSFIISALFILGNFYTTLWHTYAAFHFWLIMGFITLNIDNSIINSFQINRKKYLLKKNK